MDIVHCKNCIFYEIHDTTDPSTYFKLPNFEWYYCTKYHHMTYPAGYCAWAILNEESHLEWMADQITNLKIAINDYYKNKEYLNIHVDKED